MTIYRYKLQPGLNEIKINGFYKILSTGEQHDDFYVWILTGNKKEELIHPLKILCVMTGEEIDNSIDIINYIGSAHLLNGSVVSHAFECV